MTQLRKAIELMEEGDWEAAHLIVQADASDLASWAHAIVHLMEGDHGNAGYWYRRAGRPMPDAPVITEEIAELKAAL
jgi:hypothetical protein